MVAFSFQKFTVETGITSRRNAFEVIFHERVRVFYQGFQTRENNGIVIVIVM